MGCAPGCKKEPSCGDGRVQAPWEGCDNGSNASWQVRPWLPLRGALR
jgi:hypothetical protein